MPPLAAAALVLAVLQGGCAPWINGTLREMERVRRSMTADPAPLDSIELEVFLIERPQGDPLTGDVLWKELDQISSVDAATRQHLQANGLRFGVAGSSHPYALNGLTAVTADLEPGRRTSRQVYATPSGTAHEIPCGELPDPVIIRHNSHGELREREYHLAQGVIRCQATHTEAGWVKLVVVPEIHHGRAMMRHEADADGWRIAGGKEVDVLYSEQFHLGLNEGESLVLGAAGDQFDSVGSRLFRTSPNGGPVEKLIVIRLKSIGQVQAVSQSGG